MFLFLTFWQKQLSIQVDAFKSSSSTQNSESREETTDSTMSDLGLMNDSGEVSEGGYGAIASSVCCCCLICILILYMIGRVEGH